MEKLKLPELKSLNEFKEEFLFESISLNKLMLDIMDNSIIFYKFFNLKWKREQK